MLGTNRLPLPAALSAALVRPPGHRPPMVSGMTTVITQPSVLGNSQPRSMQSTIMSTINQRPIQCATVAARHPSTMMPPPETLPPESTNSKERNKDKPGRSTPRADRFNPSTPQEVARMARVNDPRGTRLVKLRIDNETIWVPARNVVINPEHIKQEDGNGSSTSLESTCSSTSNDLIFPDDVKPITTMAGQPSDGPYYTDIASILTPGTLISNTDIKQLEKSISSSENKSKKSEINVVTPNASLNLAPKMSYDPKTQTTTVNITIEQINSLMKGNMDEKLKEEVLSVMKTNKVLDKSQLSSSLTSSISSTPSKPSIPVTQSSRSSTSFHLSTPQRPSPQFSASIPSCSSTPSPILSSSIQSSSPPITPKSRGGVCSFTFGKKPVKPNKPSTPVNATNSSINKPKPKTPVCSFLFGPKYKMMSKIKETIGEATGKAVKPPPK
ncbi:unnamed protein product, partial [Meganyctiphanes norvegica]